MKSAADMAKYVEIAPCVVEGSPDAHNVFFQATNQRFTVTPYACDTKEEAEWFKEQFCVALAKVVNDSAAYPFASL